MQFLKAFIKNIFYPMCTKISALVAEKGAFVCQVCYICTESGVSMSVGGSFCHR